MDFANFKAGSFRKQFQFRSFHPEPINHEWTWSDPQIHTLLAEANRHLGELNAFSLIVPDVDRFICMHVVKEAQTSMRRRLRKTFSNTEADCFDPNEDLRPHPTGRI